MPYFHILLFQPLMFYRIIFFLGDGTMRIWNPALGGGRPQMSLQVHDAEVLSCSWCKYDSNIIATAGSDGLIRGWDLRVLTLPIFEQRVRN